ncbi:hypothetical protein DXA39_04905 [Anaerococcus nagyae]|uniref:Uncharacterized protein n=2 Tax=Peptoniphilaceae TaxID=1570339 RepID=A0A3E2TIJ4_9FIRM|nr:hypothetical protein DXA39_04905 [Anaerococcus nagyae]
MMNENEKLKLFETFRKESIDLLDESKIDKDSFLSNNLAYIENLDLKPFSTINNISQAIYNYQYYNLMAKKTNLKAQEISHNPKKKKSYLKLINQRENFYHLKDLATLRVLELIDYKDVDSYFIILKSKRLQGKIFEIHVNSIEKVILHSKSKVILEKLIENEVFSSEPRKSLIDSYVNKSY